jgi:predicted HicB family RNase H-like nuclease
MAPMKTNHQESQSQCLQRINLRLSAEALAAIDAECACRVGNVSRNTWIVEAIQERLDRLKLSESSSIKGDG